MKKLFVIFNCLSLIFNTFCFSQNKKNDSLWSIYNNKSQADTNRLKAINFIAGSLTSNNPDSAIVLAEQEIKLAQLTKQKKYEGKSYNIIGISFTNKGDFQKSLKNNFTAIKIFEEIGYKNGISGCYLSIGTSYWYQADYPKALEYYFKSIKIGEEIRDNKGLASCYRNIGAIYYNQTDYPKALQCYLKALKMYEEINDKQGIGSCYNNIGLVYKDQSNYPKALDYFLKSLKICEEVGYKRGLSNSYSNIALIYSIQNKPDLPKALEYCLKSLKVSEEINDKQGIGVCYGNMGEVFRKQYNYNKSLEYYLKNFKIAEEIGDKKSIVSCYINIADLYRALLDFKNAIKYSESALKISKEIGDIEIERKSYESLSVSYALIGRYKEAYENHIKFKTLTDSIFNAENSKELGDMKTKFEVEKKETELKAKASAQQVINAEEKKRQLFVIYGVAGMLLIVFVFSVFLFRRFKITQRQKIIIEQQKNLVEEHQREIIDSITYAKRIQQAILPPPEFIKQYLPETFIYYKPKDIVAGDFYWMEHLDNVTFIAAADSTGHGVPGAMVSVVCSNALNRAVKEFGLRDPGKILDKTRDLVLETFEKSGEEIKDGMDISLCRINTLTNQVQWSGANNQLWYIKKQGAEVLEIKANKQPIGNTHDPKPFTTHILDLQIGDTIYLMTDGYPDQFGGEKGKKFKYKQLEENLLTNSHKPLEEQKGFLIENFETWKGNLEQVDDVTIIGIRL